MEKLVVFTYAPAGLGHIRVAEALISGIPQDIPYVEFSPADNTTESMHRFSSLNVPARHIMEFLQRGSAELLFTKTYTHYLKTHPDGLPEQFVSLIRAQDYKPEKIVVVATHFGLAYQLGAIKGRLERELGTKIVLVVQITDDSPQVIWYVDLADLIVAPSQKTKDKLLAHAAKNYLRQIPIEVAPYPVDLDFAKTFPPEKVAERRNQYRPDQNTPINIAIPVSGAAVGMEFFLHLISRLHNMSARFHFHIICRKAPFTESFLHKIGLRDYVTLYISSQYKSVVELYKQVYLNKVIAAEVTKPSEQAFKVLLESSSAGGSFLLLAEPVGRQEHDNIDFLNRQGFLSDEFNSRRGYILPHGSKASAELIWDLFKNGKLLKAFDEFVPKKPDAETGHNGVAKFWELLCQLCRST